jgi:hypothetical protein
MEVLNVGVDVGRHGIHLYENYVHILWDVYCEDQFLIVEEIRNTEKQNPLTDQKIKPTDMLDEISDWSQKITDLPETLCDLPTKSTDLSEVLAKIDLHNIFEILMKLAYTTMHRLSVI